MPLANNVQNEAVTVHRSYEVLKILSLSIANQSHLRHQTVETAKMNPASWIAWLEGKDYGCLIWSNLQQLHCPSCTRLWHSSIFCQAFQWLSMYMLKFGSCIIKYSSVSTRCLCSCFLSIKSPADLSLFNKLCNVCLLGTLPSQNLRRNFRRHFLADLFSRRCRTEIYVPLKYTTPCWNILLTNCNWE
jgi:hypothetical protein